MEEEVKIVDELGEEVTDPDLLSGYISNQYLLDDEGNKTLVSRVYYKYPDVSSQIASLKQSLTETDYVITKISEYNVRGESIPEEDAERYASIIEQRAQWRAKINELEA